MTSFNERLLAAVAEPAVRLSRSGRILGWNSAAEALLSGLAKRKPIAPLLPEHLREPVAAALQSNEVDTPIAGGCVLRSSARERLLLLHAPQTATFDELPMPLVVWQHDGNPQSARELRLIAANRIAGHPRGERLRNFVGTTRAELSPIPALDEVYLEVARTGEPRLVRNLEDSHGNTYNARVFALGPNQIAAAFENTIDARRAERGYRTIFERSHDAIVIIDPENEAILEANSVAVELYGRGSLDGVTIQQLSRNYRSGLGKHILQERFVRFQTVHVHGSGRDLHLDVNTTVIDYEGRPAFLAMMHDVSAQLAARAAAQASEEKYRAVVANAPIIIWTMTDDAQATFISPSVERVTGFTTDEVAEPKLWYSRIHDEDRAAYLDVHQTVFRTRVPYDFEYRFLRKDGEWAWLQERAHRVDEKDGHVVVEGVTTDITARKTAELELARRQAQLAEAQSITHIGSMEIDLDTGQVDWSDEMYRIAGLEPQSQRITLDIVGRLVPAEVIANVGESLIEQEHVMFRVDGSARTVLSRARLVTDSATGRRRIVGTVQDVTEKRQAELALRAHEARLQLIVERLPVLLWSTDAELRLDSLTGAGFGHSNPDTLADLTLTIHDLLGEMSDDMNAPQQAMRGDSLTFDTVQGERDLRVHIEPLRNDDGMLIGTVGIAFDRTEERRADRARAELLERLHDAAEEWRETFDSIQAPIVIVDAETKITRLNAAALAHSRFEAYSDAIGEPVAGVGEMSIWKDIDAIARASANHRTAISLQGVDHDGRYWDLLASPSRQDQTIVIASEVTELMRMQDKLRRTERMSEMGALVAGVAHEVRNPLFGISAMLDAFEARFGSEQFSGYIAALREQVDRMSQLMHELLEYGRPLNATFEAVCLSGVLTAAISSTSALARQHEVTINSSVPPVLEKVNMDRPRMLQVFENLLNNAIQHSARGGVIDLSHDLDEENVTIFVEDRGPGFAGDDVTRIFEPFFTRRRNGTGLGLSLVRRIVEEHNGTVVASNREGGGATLTVTLPRAEAAR